MNNQYREVAKKMIENLLKIELIKRLTKRKFYFNFFFFSKFWPQGERNEQPKENVKNW